MCSEVPAILATTVPEEKLDRLATALKASRVEFQIVRAKFEHQIADLQMKLQSETSPKVKAKWVTEVKQATDSIIATITQCDKLLD